MTLRTLSLGQRYTVYMRHVTVSKVLDLEVFRFGNPELISQPEPEANAKMVRWMHILETARPDGLLPGGEFILTTATFLDQATSSSDMGVNAANQFLDTIEATGAVAVAAEVLPERARVGEALRIAAKDRRTPIYLLSHRIRFVELTQMVHETIAASRLQEVETDRRIHEAFTRLSVGSASTDRIVGEATALLGCTVHWEPTDHRDFRAGVVAHQVVAGDEVLGRLVIKDMCRAETSLVQTVLERAGQAVSISVLAHRSQLEMRRSTAASLFYQLRDGTKLSAQEVQWRLTETFGYAPFADAHWVPGVFRIWGAQPNEEQLNRWSGVLLDVLEDVGTAHKVPIFAARSELGVVDILVATRQASQVDALIEATRTRFVTRLQHRSRVVAGLAGATDSAKSAAEQLVHASHIARAAQAYVEATANQGSHFYAKDLGLRGLLATLRDDKQLGAFVSTELAPLLRHHPDQQSFEHQLGFVEAILTAENKAALARKLHMSRPALYARINRLESQLGYGLESDAEQRTATHLAIMAYRLNPDHMFPVLQQHA